MDNITAAVMHSTTIRSQLSMDFDRAMQELSLNNKDGEFYLALFGKADLLARELVGKAEALRTTMDMLAEQRRKIVNV